MSVKDIAKLTNSSQKQVREIVHTIENWSPFIEYARMEGIMEGKKEIVLNAVNKGLSIEFIAEITSLSPEQIHEILSER